jgi:hypothetical protein
MQVNQEGGVIQRYSALQGLSVTEGPVTGQKASITRVESTRTPSGLVIHYGITLLIIGKSSFGLIEY